MTAPDISGRVHSSGQAESAPQLSALSAGVIMHAVSIRSEITLRVPQKVKQEQAEERHQAQIQYAGHPSPGQNRTDD